MAEPRGEGWGSPQGTDGPGRALPLAFELLHDLQEAVVGGGVAAEADLHLVQVGERILHLRAGRC